MLVGIDWFAHTGNSPPTRFFSFADIVTYERVFHLFVSEDEQATDAWRMSILDAAAAIHRRVHDDILGVDSSAGARCVHLIVWLCPVVSCCSRSRKCRLVMTPPFVALFVRTVSCFSVARNRPRDSGSFSAHHLERSQSSNAMMGGGSVSSACT